MGLHETLKHLDVMHFRYLDRYEKVHFLGEDGQQADDDDEDSRHRKWSARALHSVPLTYNHHQHNIAGEWWLNVLNASLSETCRKFSIESLDNGSQSAYIRAVYRHFIGFAAKYMNPQFRYIAFANLCRCARLDTFRVHVRTAGRLSNAFPHVSPIVFLLVALLSSRRARTQRFSPFLPLSHYLFLCLYVRVTVQ